jgi:transcriptional regulator with XRE-family HTH domain
MESFGVLFGQLICDKRGIEGLSQDDLAGKSGLTKARISEIENGKINRPQAKTVDALCVALNISREERDECRIITGPRLPPRLLENLALRFGHSNPDALEDELEAFLKEKAAEFREMQARLAQMNGAEGRISDLLAAANAALEEGDFQIADERLAEAEDTQLSSTTLPVLERQCKLRFERGYAALLNGEMVIAVQHWESAVNYFHFLDQEIEAEKRYEYCTRLQEHGYRYRSVEALCAAGNALERNLPIWSKENNLEKWCRAMTALGDVSWRLSQFDGKEKFAKHIAKAKYFYETVRENCSEAVLSYHFAISGRRLASIYSDRELAASEGEYYDNLVISLQLQNSALNLISKSDHPVDWGISQHNLGLSYTQFFELQANKSLAMDIIDKAISHLELSFEVRDSASMLQYWVASCRSLGEALIERSMCQTNAQACNDLERSYELLISAASNISEIEHPNQWAQIQDQLARCSEQRLRMHRMNDPAGTERTRRSD